MDLPVGAARVRRVRAVPRWGLDRLAVSACVVAMYTRFMTPSAAR